MRLQQAEIDFDVRLAITAIVRVTLPSKTIARVKEIWLILRLYLSLKSTGVQRDVQDPINQGGILRYLVGGL